MVLYEDTSPIIEWSRRQKNGVLDFWLQLAWPHSTQVNSFTEEANARFPAIFYSKPEKDRDSLVIEREE